MKIIQKLKIWRKKLLNNFICKIIETEKKHNLYHYNNVKIFKSM